MSFINKNEYNNTKHCIKLNWILGLISLAFISVTLSCDKINKVPPRTEGTYSKKFQLPEPERLTYEERTYINDLQEEYDKNTN